MGRPPRAHWVCTRLQTVLIVQGDWLNLSQIATVVCVPLTTNLRWAEAPGNVLLSARVTGLPKDSVANLQAFCP